MSERLHFVQTSYLVLAPIYLKEGNVAVTIDFVPRRVFSFTLEL